MNQFQDEQQIIEGISNGDVRAFEQLFSKYFICLHHVAYNRLKSKQAADDLVQDVFADIWKNRKSLNIHTSVQAYLHQAIKYKVYKFIRHQAVREKEMVIRRIRDEYYAVNTFPDTEEVVGKNEFKNLMTHHLDQLPEKTRYIFHLSREEHFTHSEIAKKLNCSPKTIEYHIGKVLQHLRLSLKNHISILIAFCLSIFM